MKTQFIQNIRPMFLHSRASSSHLPINFTTRDEAEFDIPRQEYVYRGEVQLSCNYRVSERSIRDGSMPDVAVPRHIQTLLADFVYREVRNALVDMMGDVHRLRIDPTGPAADRVMERVQGILDMTSP